MELKFSNESTLPWIWSIELLASNPRADFGTIRDVAKDAPGLSEGAAEYARELIALRCLEGLYKMGCEIKGGARGDDLKIGLDLSQSSSAILHRLTKETGGTKPALAALDVTKWNIPAFVAHKRASLPKCTFLPLKEMLVEGTHPAAVSIRERSGIVLRDQNTGRGLLDGVPKGVSSVCDRASRQHEETKESEKIISSIPLNEFGEDSCRITNDTDLRQKDLVGRECDLVSGSDHQSKAAKRSKEENRVDRPELVSGSGDRVICDQHGVTFPINVGSYGGKVLLDHSLNKERVSGQNVCDELLHENGAVGCELRQKTLRLSFQSKRESCIVEDSQSEGDEDHNEEVEVASLKENFLSSQSTTLEWSEPTFCVKCNKGGSLLCCSFAACPVAVHEHCLGSPPCFDDNGSFQCPFCLCSLTTVAYLEAKKIVSIRKKELNTYLDSRQVREFSQRVPDRRKKRHVKQKGLSDPIRSHDNEENGEMNKTLGNVDVDHVNCTSPRTMETANVSAREEPPVVCVDNHAAGQEAGSQNSGHVDVIIQDDAIVRCADDILPLEKDTFHKTDEPPLPSEKIKHQDCRAIVLYEDKGTDNSGTVSQNLPEAKTMPARPIRLSPTTRISPQAPHISYHAYPLNRKRKVPWTTEEEKKLKEGVRTFYKPETGQRVIPWGQILEFGAVVFHLGRTAENLKDKWRNICKKGG